MTEVFIALLLAAWPVSWFIALTFWMVTNGGSPSVEKWGQKWIRIFYTIGTIVGFIIMTILFVGLFRMPPGGY